MTRSHRTGIAAVVVAGLWLAGVPIPSRVRGGTSPIPSRRVHYLPDRANTFEVPPTLARFVRVVISSGSGGREHEKAAPRTFGTLQSRLWKTLEAPGGHHGAILRDDERDRIKCWIDLNCPLWPDYKFRPDRPATAPPVAVSGRRN